MTPHTHTALDAPASSGKEKKMPPLEPGDRLDQKTFHERYEAMPEHVKAELIGGIVYMPSPPKPKHGRMHSRLMKWFLDYEDHTPGVEGYDNTTAILDEESEPQPDGYLIISPDQGGQMHYNVDEYLVGPPELIGEVASSTESIDLHAKRDAYEQAGVREYLVVALRQARVFWFVLREGRFQEMQPGADGILRSEIFPGLWLDPAALLRRDGKRLTEVLQQGIATPEHTAFVARLASTRKPDQQS
jgi:Uma2 family endonuclease